MQNKQEILEDAYGALAKSIKLCKCISSLPNNLTGSRGDYTIEWVGEWSRNFAESSYYLSQVIKELENK